VDADWSVAPGSANTELDVTIASLPAANGSAITDIEYELDASGTWVSSGGTTSFTITGLTAATSYDVRLRAVNGNGSGAAGNTESATTGTASTTTPTFSGAGSGTALFGGITVSLPAHSSGDILTVAFLARPADTMPPAPSGWTLESNIVEGSLGDDCRLGVYTKTAASSSEPDPSFADAGGHNQGIAFVVSGASSVSVLNTGTGNTTSVSIPGGTTGGSNRLIVDVLGNRILAQTADQVSSEANSDLTGFTEEAVYQTTGAQDGGINIYSGEKATAGTVGATTGTLASAASWCGIKLEFAP